MPQADGQPEPSSDNRAFYIAIGIISSFVLILAAVYIGAMNQMSCESVGRLFVSAAQLSANLPGADAQTVLSAVTSITVPDRCSTVTWDEYFRTGFVLLGGTLTTIMGYFFGSRGVERAQDSAAKAQSLSEQLSKRVESVEAQAETAERNAAEAVETAQAAIDGAESQLVESRGEEASTVDEQAQGIELPN